MLPFSVEQFFGVFAAYNNSVWPAPVIGYLLGLAAVGALFTRSDWSGRLICACLAIMWLWSGIFFHALFFSEVCGPAYGFAVLFVLQGLLLLVEGVIRGRVRFRAGGGGSWASRVGWFFILYASVLYQLAGIVAGHQYPATPLFGTAPCPVTIFTFGMLLLAGRRHWGLLVIPCIWSLVGGSAAVFLNVPQDFVLLIGGAVTLAMLHWGRIEKGAAAS